VLDEGATAVLVADVDGCVVDERVIFDE